MASVASPNAIARKLLPVREVRGDAGVILNAHDKALLIALRQGNHFKANPGDVTELLQRASGDVGPSEGLSSARRLHAEGLAVFVPDSDAPGQTFMRITDTGIALADNLIEERRSKSWQGRLAALPVGKGAWDLIKIGFGVVLGVLATQFFGQPDETTEGGATTGFAEVERICDLPAGTLSGKTPIPDMNDAMPKLACAVDESKKRGLSTRFISNPVDPNTQTN